MPQSSPNWMDLRRAQKGPQWPHMRPSDPIRLRLRELLDARGVSQTQVCQRLTAKTGELWRMSRLSKLLNGHIVFCVDDLVLIAQVADVSLVDLFREPGREFVADMTPTELKMIHAFRDHPSVMRPIADVIAMLTPQRKPSRAIVRERMRRAKLADP